jgi:hypothetical protein
MLECGRRVLRYALSLTRERRRPTETEVPMNQSIDHSSITKSGADSEPLSAQKRRFWVLDQLERTYAPHNVPAGLEIRGSLDLSTLEKAIRVVLDRRSRLSSHCVLENYEPRAVPCSPRVQSVPAGDLAHMPQTGCKLAVYAVVAKELREAFDSHAGSQLRATFYQLGDTEHLLAFTFNEIVCGSVSSLMFTKELVFLTIAIQLGTYPKQFGLPHTNYRSSLPGTLAAGCSRKSRQVSSKRVLRLFMQNRRTLEVTSWR